jgi:predicted O-linked N-acetylglucosamine transferase (SPINDLY family)
MHNITPTISPDYSESAEKSAFISAEQGNLELIELMGAADRLNAAGLKDQTISLYKLWLENTTSPLAYVGYFNLGVELASGRETIQAEAMYRKALEQNPQFIRARLNLGNCLEQQKRDDEALEEWRIALETESIHLPENLSLQLHALNNLGRLLEIKKNYQESLVMLEKSFSLDPTQQDVLLHLVHLIQKICRWPIYVPPKGITKQEMINGTSPLAMLAASDDPALQLAAAKQFVDNKYPVTSNEAMAPRCGYAHEKIRIGYLSSDFCLHAVSLLTVELLELHNHERFEVYGFCWSREDGTSIQNRIIKAMDHYIKIGNMNDKEVAECIRSHEIDIMVDLQGLTSGARPLILSYRPAPLQMTYLGFPGTTGLPWIDYVIADKYLIPDELTPYHTEKPLYMPNCFQSSDTKREVGSMPTRAENGLPEKAFVFCSFNNNYKFTPELFAVWMRILKRVPGSVFWLLADNEWAKENLLKTAKKFGIKKDRLIFASRVAPADYLARYQLADLFLDTFPFNGGTTANDALFMGLPLLTLSGRTFASRMAGSLLSSLGLPELITSTPLEYEETAVKLAKSRDYIGNIRTQLKERKNSAHTFMMAEFTKDYETVLESKVKEKRQQKSDGKDRNLEGLIDSNNHGGKMTQSPVTQGDILNLLNLIRPWQMASDYKIRIGSEADGGYVLPSCCRKTNLVISIGIGNEVSFDRELAFLGAKILQFDHTIAGAPLEHENIRFMRQGWGAVDSAKDNLLSLRSMLGMADWVNAQHPILKFDTEGAEWDAIVATDSNDLNLFEIITGEFHDFPNLINRDHFNRVSDVFEKLGKTHNVVHMHANNAGGLVMIGGIPFPRLLELTYLRKNAAVFAGHSFEPIPGPLDRPNVPQFPDIHLRAF